MKNIISLLSIVTFLALVSIRADAQLMGVDINPPISILHVFESTTNTGVAAGLTVEQDNTGDAVIQYLLTGGQRWVMGIDNDDADLFKISAITDLTNGQFYVDASGNVAMESNNTLEITTPKELLQVGESNASTSTIRVEGTQTGGDDFAASIIFQEENQVSPSGTLEIGYDGTNNAFLIELGGSRVVSQVEGTDDFDIAGTVVGGFGMMDVSFTRDDEGDNDFVAIAVACNPITNNVFVRVVDNKNINIQALDNDGRWTAWVDFGNPGAGQIMSVGVDISHDGLADADAYAVMIVARMDDGTTYVRTSNADNTTLANLDATGSYGA